MLESLPICLLVGGVLGFLAGLGVGGGSLLILWLTLALGWEPQRASSVNLLFFLPAAAVSTAFRWKQGLPRGRGLILAIVSGCIAAWVFSLLRVRMDTQLLRRLFGLLLLATGVRELRYRH